MRKKMKKEHRTVIQLLIGILLWGVLVQAAGLILAADRLHFAVGLWCGVFMSAGMAVHMYITLEHALELGERRAPNHVRKGYAIRMAVVTILFGLIIWLGIGSIVATFLGLMALKPAAYLQPFLEKQMLRRET